MPNLTTGRYGLKDIPRSEFGGNFALQAADIDTGVISGTMIPQAGITPDQLGLPVINKTGSPITAGKLVYVNGWDATSGRQSIALASASGEATLATWVTLASIADGAIGTVGSHFSLTAQNTNAATVGDAVYLNTTAGGYTLTSGPALGLLYQSVGRVVVKSATVGVIDFDIDSALTLILERVNMAIPTVATTGTTESQPIRIDRAGTILGLSLVFLTALSINGTNYVTFSANNRTQSKLLTAAVVGNSTNTGGTAITQYGPFALAGTATGADLVVAAGDVLTVNAAVTGTLGAALNGSWSVVLQPN